MPALDTITVHYLEMTAADQLRPAQTVRSDLAILRAEVPSPEFSRFLYETVGREWNWSSRSNWSRHRWMEHLDRPELETWVGYVSGTPAGYCELEHQPDGNVEIVQFGLLPSFIGQGLGGRFLTEMVERVWTWGTARLWLHTCTHDHPHALANYLARGFRLFQEETAKREWPTLPPVWPTDP